MINEPLRRGQLCYWKKNTTYSEISFVALVQMPKPPHAVKAVKGGEEYILKDCEVFPSIKEAFCDKHKDIIGYLKEFPDHTKADCARRLVVPYSRVLNVNKEAIKLGVIHAKETKEIQQ